MLTISCGWLPHSRSPGQSCIAPPSGPASTPTNARSLPGGDKLASQRSNHGSRRLLSTCCSARRSTICTSCTPPLNDSSIRFRSKAFNDNCNRTLPRIPLFHRNTRRTSVSSLSTTRRDHQAGCCATGFEACTRNVNHAPQCNALRRSWSVCPAGRVLFSNSRIVVTRQNVLHHWNAL